jgi:phosphoribosylanthranilate isomerase
MQKINFNNFIQIAGVIDQQEADMLIDCGVNYLGFPLRLPVNKEDLTEEEAKEIIQKLDPPNYGIVISYSSTADEAIELCDKMGVSIIQLHGPIKIEELVKLKSIKPELAIIKSLVISNDNVVELLNNLTEFEPYVDAFITDTYDPTTGASGATGKTHNWEISKKFVDLSSKPIILAGGLNPENVYDAILKVKPAGVDVHTGVENSSGRKEKHLVIKFFEQSKKAFEFVRQ